MKYQVIRTKLCEGKALFPPVNCKITDDINCAYRELEYQFNCSARVAHNNPDCNCDFEIQEIQ